MSETLTTTRPTTAAPSAAAQPVLQVVSGNKIYGGVHAIEGINFDLYAGEVHALVGENGAGKSTLCKAIAGAIKLTSGEYYVDGKPINFERPRDALAAGICMVYQETSLVPTMTAAQNIELGNEKLITSFKKLNIQAQQLLQSLNFHIDPATPVGLLGTAKRQMVEIARAVYNDARIINKQTALEPGDLRWTSWPQGRKRRAKPPRRAASPCCRSWPAARSTVACMPSRTSTSISTRARCTRWLARTVPASRPCARRSPAPSS